MLVSGSSTRTGFRLGIKSVTGCACSSLDFDPGNSYCVRPSWRRLYYFQACWKSTGVTSQMRQHLFETEEDSAGLVSQLTADRSIMHTTQMDQKSRAVSCFLTLAPLFSTNYKSAVGWREHLLFSLYSRAMGRYF